MTQRKSIPGSDYTPDWSQVAQEVKAKANWKCIRCGHIHEPETGFCLTVHHLDMNPSNNAWWNLLALCQRCHLQIQAKVVIERPYMFEHSEWFKPYVAGYYAHIHQLPDDETFVKEHIDQLLDYGRPYPIYKAIQK